MKFKSRYWLFGPMIDGGTGTQTGSLADWLAHLSSESYVIGFYHMTAILSPEGPKTLLPPWPRSHTYRLEARGKKSMFSDQHGHRVADVKRPIRLIQCRTQFRSLGVKVLSVLYLHDNIAFTFKWYGNTWNKTFYLQRIWIGYNIELAKLVYWRC